MATTDESLKAEQIIQEALKAIGKPFDEEKYFSEIEKTTPVNRFYKKDATGKLTNEIRGYGLVVDGKKITSSEVGPQYTLSSLTASDGMALSNEENKKRLDAAGADSLENKIGEALKEKAEQIIQNALKITKPFNKEKYLAEIEKTTPVNRFYKKDETGKLTNEVRGYALVVDGKKINSSEVGAQYTLAGLAAADGVVLSNEEKKKGWSMATKEREKTGMDTKEPEQKKEEMAGMGAREPEQKKEEMAGMGAREPEQKKEEMAGMDAKEPEQKKEEMAGMDVREPEQKKEEMAGMDVREPEQKKEEMAGMDAKEPEQKKEEMAGMDAKEPEQKKEEKAGMGAREPEQKKEEKAGMGAREPEQKKEEKAGMGTREPEQKKEEKVGMGTKEPENKEYLENMDKYKRRNINLEAEGITGKSDHDADRLLSGFEKAGIILGKSIVALAVGIAGSMKRIFKGVVNGVKNTDNGAEVGLTCLDKDGREIERSFPVSVILDIENMYSGQLFAYEELPFDSDNRIAGLHADQLPEVGPKLLSGHAPFIEGEGPQNKPTLDYTIPATKDRAAKKIKTAGRLQLKKDEFGKVNAVVKPRFSKYEVKPSFAGIPMTTQVLQNIFSKPNVGAPVQFQGRDRNGKSIVFNGTIYFDQKNNCLMMNTTEKAFDAALRYHAARGENVNEKAVIPKVGDILVKGHLVPKENLKKDLKKDLKKKPLAIA